MEKVDSHDRVGSHLEAHVQLSAKKLATHDDTRTDIVAVVGAKERIFVEAV